MAVSWPTMVAMFKKRPRYIQKASKYVTSKFSSFYDLVYVADPPIKPTKQSTSSKAHPAVSHDTPIVSTVKSQDLL
jgi:hypothetical protein